MRIGWVAALCLVASCTDDTAKQDEERHSVQAQIQARRAEAARNPQPAAPPPTPATGPDVTTPGGPGCEVAAERMIKRMDGCGFSMDGISPAMLCAKINATAIRFFASRKCDELSAALGAAMK